MRGVLRGCVRHASATSNLSDYLPSLMHDGVLRLVDADFADTGQHLDRMRDTRLAPLLPGGSGDADGIGGDVAWLRRQFADWPRDAAPRQD
jgi:hypothetical protein